MSHLKVQPEKHIIIKLPRVKDKEKIFKAAEKNVSHIKEPP